jgi:chromosome segregation ATPase
MGSFVAVLKAELSQRNEQYRQARADLDKNLKEIKRLTEQLKLSEDQKRTLADRFTAAEAFPAALSSFAPSVTLGSQADQFRLVIDSLKLPLPSTLVTSNKEMEEILRRSREVLESATSGIPKLPKP